MNDLNKSKKYEGILTICETKSFIETLHKKPSKWMILNNISIYSNLCEIEAGKEFLKFFNLKDNKRNRFFISFKKVDEPKQEPKEKTNFSALDNLFLFSVLTTIFVSLVAVVFKFLP